jgi:hypothetical protein
MEATVTFRILINQEGNPNTKLKDEDIKVIQVAMLKVDRPSSGEPLTHAFT